MKSSLSFFLGIIAGVLITIAASFFISERSSKFSGLSLFDERGEMMQVTGYVIIKTLDESHALAIGPEDIVSLLRPVLIIGDKNDHFYDGLEVKVSGNKCFYQVGTYQYQTKDESWRTVPAVTLLEKN